MHIFSRGLILAGGALGLAWAARPSALTGTPDPSDTTGVTTTVTVRNDRSARVTLYLEQSDAAIRLGTVGANSTATLRLPEAVVREQHEIQIFAHPAGSIFDLAGQTLAVQPGSRLDVVVPSSAEIAPTEQPAVDPDPGSPATTVMVENTRDQAVVVFAETGDFDTRLGTVPAHQAVTLRIPDRLTLGERIDLFVHPEGGFDLASDAMPVRRGDHLHLVVPRGAA